MAAVETCQHTSGKLEWKETLADEIRRPNTKSPQHAANKPTRGKEEAAQARGVGWVPWRAGRKRS